MKYQLVRCFPVFSEASSDFLTNPVLMGSPSSHLGFSDGWSTFTLDIWSSDRRMFAQLSHICQLIFSPIRVWQTIHRQPELGPSFQRQSVRRGEGWHFNVAKGTEVRFNLPQKISNSYASLGFCAWYIIANSVSGYNINSTCIKWIKAMFQVKKGSKTTHLKGMDEFLQAELEVDLTGTG